MYAARNIGEYANGHQQDADKAHFASRSTRTASCASARNRRALLHKTDPYEHHPDDLLQRQIAGQELRRGCTSRPGYKNVAEKRPEARFQPAKTCSHAHKGVVAPSRTPCERRQRIPASRPVARSSRPAGTPWQSGDALLLTVPAQVSDTSHPARIQCASTPSDRRARSSVGVQSASAGVQGRTRAGGLLRCSGEKTSLCVTVSTDTHETRSATHRALHAAP